MSPAAVAGPSANRPPAPQHGRMAVVVACLLCAFIAFVGKAYLLQIVRADEILDKQPWRVETAQRVRAPRGELLDRNGDILAANAPAFDIAIDPHLLRSENPDAVEQVRAEIEGLTRFNAERWARWMEAPLDEVPGYYLLARGVLQPEAQRLATRMDALGVRAVFRTPGHRRVYPNGTVGAHVIGALDAAGELGIAGAERTFDALMRGREVEMHVQRDARRRAYLFEDAPDLRRAAGNTVVLAVDRRIQQAAEEELATVCEDFEATLGVVVVSRPQTGELLAVAVWPPFNPNGRELPENAWANPAVALNFEPGSTTKVFTFASAIDAGGARFDDVYSCNGGNYSLGGKQMRDEYCHGSIAAWQVVRDSSNIGAIALATSMSPVQHHDYLRRFGFGASTESGLPGERSGTLPPPPWGRATQGTISYGYGLDASLLQLNMATAAVANGGVLMRPIVALRVVGPDGDVLQTFEPQERGRVLSPESAALTRDAMMTVVSREGTGKRAVIPGFTAAGKTGTARFYDGAYSADEHRTFFTGFTPAYDPEIAITVMVERPDPARRPSGGTVAAPIFGRVGRRALEALQRLPDAPVEPVTETAASEGSVSATPTMAVDDAVDDGREAADLDGTSVPDLTGLWVAEATRRAHAAGLRVSVLGTGRVVSQWPLAGEAGAAGQRVVLTLEAP